MYAENMYCTKYDIVVTVFIAIADVFYHQELCKGVSIYILCSIDFLPLNCCLFYIFLNFRHKTLINGMKHLLCYKSLYLLCRHF